MPAFLLLEEFMKIKNIEIDFNFLDADNVEKFEKEAQKVVEKSEENKNAKITYSEALRKECEVVEDFIDSVFGEGLSEKIFKGNKDLLDHIKVFQDIVDEKNSKQSELQSIYNRYAPNREQRRKGRR